MKNKRLILVSIIIAAVLSLWVGGIIPQLIGRISASIYAANQYPDKGLKYVRTEFSSAHGDYFAIFADRDGKPVNFLMTPRYFPAFVLYDPLNPPG